VENQGEVRGRHYLGAFWAGGITTLLRLSRLPVLIVFPKTNEFSTENGRVFHRVMEFTLRRGAYMGA
jgi:hypothetical protein